MEELLRQVVGIARAMWRRRWTGLAVAWAVALIGAWAISRIPDRYEASARVFVDTESLLKPLMAGLTIEPNLDQKVGMLARTLLTRPNLEVLMRKSDLDLEALSQRQREAMLERLSRDIHITSSGRENLYNISYRDTNPERAKLLVQNLVSMFVESGLGDKKRDAENARNFIEEQIKSHEKRLTEAENRLKEFKLRNLAYADSTGKDYFARMSALTEELSKMRVDLRVAEQARDALRRELAGEDPVLLPEPSAPAGGVVSTTELDARIEAQKKLLDELLRRYTDEHPDVVGTRRLLGDLEAQKAAELEARRKAAAARGAPKLSAATNPVFQQIRIALADAEANVAALRTRVAEMQARLDQLRSAAGRVPQLEAEQAQLNRDYDIIKRNYDALVAKREQVTMSEDVDTSVNLVEFRVIEPPRASQRPVFPNRFSLVPLLLLGALGAGLVVCFALAQLYPTFDSTKALRNATQRPVLGAVSMLISPQSQRRAWRGTLAFASALSALVIGCVSWMAWLHVFSTRV